MSKRLRVLVDELELRRMQQVARQRGMSLAEWVRQVLQLAMREEPLREVQRKLAAVREAARHEFPAPDIDTMLDELGGYRSGSPP